MRRSVVAGIAVIVALLMVITLSGCGGGDTPAEDTGAAPTGDGGAAAPQSAAGDSKNLSPKEPSTFEPFPTDNGALPEAVAQRRESKQPILLLFYDKTQKTSDDQRAVIDGVLEDYRGLIDFVSYDVSAYVSTDASGVIEVSEGMTGDEEAQKVARLISSAYLGVPYTPYIVFVDEQGYITSRMRGYVDDKTLEIEVLRATD